MYLKFIRHNQLGGNIHRGSLYTVHFEPNEKGGYNEHPTRISDAYEIASGAVYPLPLIYEAGIRRTNGHMRQPAVHAASYRPRSTRAVLSGTPPCPPRP